MRFSPLLTLLTISLVSASAYSQQIGSNYTVAYANETIARASDYLNAINQSGYLIFYPNLTKAYDYLNRAEMLYNRSPASAVILANQAVEDAGAQYQSISSYRLLSFAVMFVISIATAGALFSVMHHRVKERRKRT